MQLDKQLYDEINEYCKMNSLKTRDFIHKILKEAFMKEKYGDSPFAFHKKSESEVIEKPVVPKMEITCDKLHKVIETSVAIVEKLEETQQLPSLSVQDTTEPMFKTDNIEKSKPKKKRTLK